MSLPLLFNENLNVSNLGNEFSSIVNANNDRGLMNPNMFLGGMSHTVRLPLNRSLTEMPGSNSQRIVTESLKNNTDPSEELDITNLTAMNNLIRSVSSRRLVRSDFITFDSETQLDPRIDEALRREAALNRSNIFSTESEDFVDDVQRSTAAFMKERNLYGGVEPTGMSPMTGAKLEGDLNGDGVVDDLDLIMAAGIKVFKETEAKRDEKIKEAKTAADLRATEVKFEKAGTEIPPGGGSTPKPKPKTTPTPTPTPTPKPQEPVENPSFFTELKLTDGRKLHLNQFFRDLKSGKQTMDDIREVISESDPDILTDAIRSHALNILSS